MGTYSSKSFYDMCAHTHAHTQACRAGDWESALILLLHEYLGCVCRGWE